MFERFTDKSRRAVVLAQEEARDLDHNYIGTEHLLAGLRRENLSLPPLHPRRTELPNVVKGLLDTIDDRLSAIERHLGIARPGNQAAQPDAGAPENVIPPS